MPSTNEIEAHIGGALINMEFAKMHLLQVMERNGCPGFSRSEEITGDVTEILLAQSHIRALTYEVDMLLKLFVAWRDTVEADEKRRANVLRSTGPDTKTS